MSQDEAAPPAPKTHPIADLIFVRIPYVVTGTLFLIAITINFANVIARYFFFEALFWAEEVLIYMTLWGVILACATITYQGLHIRMDLFATLLRSPIKEIVNALTAALLVCASIYVVMQSYVVAADDSAHCRSPCLYLDGGGGRDPAAQLHHRPLRMIALRPLHAAASGGR
jgi:TRAP-type C4-dicarboxylate transport system permease small subunit